MVLGRTIALATALLAGTVVAIQAQDNNSSIGSIKSETTFDQGSKGINREVIRAEARALTFNYASYPHTNNNDVLQIGLGLPKGFGVTFTKLGGGENAQNIFEAYKTFSTNSLDFLIDAGKGMNKDDYQWVIASATHEKFFALASLIKEGKLLQEEDMQNEVHGAVSVNHKGVYVGFGVQGFGEQGDVWKQRFVAAYNNEDFGTATFAFVNPNDNSWSFISQNAYGDISEGFYDENNYNNNVLTEYTAGPFIPQRFSKSVTKGNYSLLVKGKGNDEKTKLTAVPGMKTDLVDFGIGVNTETTSNGTETGLTAIASKNFALFKDKVKGLIDAEYDSQTRNLNVYVAVKYDF